MFANHRAKLDKPISILHSYLYGGISSAVDIWEIFNGSVNLIIQYAAFEITLHFLDFVSEKLTCPF